MYLFYVWVLCVCNVCVLGLHGAQRKVSDALELELQTILSHYVNANLRPRGECKLKALQKLLERKLQPEEVNNTNKNRGNT